MSAEEEARQGGLHGGHAGHRLRSKVRGGFGYGSLQAGVKGLWVLDLDFHLLEVVALRERGQFTDLRKGLSKFVARKGRDDICSLHNCQIRLRLGGQRLW